MGWLNAFCIYLNKVATKRGFVTQPQGKSKTIEANLLSYDRGLDGLYPELTKGTS